VIRVFLIAHGLNRVIHKLRLSAIRLKKVRRKRLYPLLITPTVAFPDRKAFIEILVSFPDLCAMFLESLADVFSPLFLTERRPLLRPNCPVLRALNRVQ